MGGQYNKLKISPKRGSNFKEGRKGNDTVKEKIFNYLLFATPRIKQFATIYRIKIPDSEMYLTDASLPFQKL